MSTPVTTNSSTWEPMHIDNPDQGPQCAKHRSVNPRETPNPPSYSGYAYVSAPLRPSQRLSARKGQGYQESSNDNDNNLIQSTVFPLPPTLAGRELDNPYHYHTFPPPLNSLPLSPTLTNPTTTNNNNGNEKNNDQQSSCYFETLDFSDYLHPTTTNRNHRLLQADNPSHQTQNQPPYRPRTNNNNNNSNAPIGRGAAAFPAHLRGKYPPSSNGYNYDTFPTPRRDNHPPLGADPGTAAAGRLDLQRGWRRATREAVVVVWIVVLLAGLLAVVGFGVMRGAEGWDADHGKGGGRFIGEVGGEDVAGDGWGLCTDARPRFCRLVVGAGAGR